MYMYMYMCICMYVYVCMCVWTFYSIIHQPYLKYGIVLILWIQVASNQESFTYCAIVELNNLDDKLNDLTMLPNVYLNFGIIRLTSYELKKPVLNHNQVFN